MFHAYFKILKQMAQSPLVPSVLEGLSRFAHLISIEFMSDLLALLRTIAANPSTAFRSALHCILAAVKIASGRGAALSRGFCCSATKHASLSLCQARRSCST